MPCLLCCRGAYRGAGSSYLRQLLRVEALPAGYDQLQDLALPPAPHSHTATNASYDSHNSHFNGHPHQQHNLQQQGGDRRAFGLQGLLADGGEAGAAAGDDELQLSLAVQAIAEAAQLGMGSVDLLYPQTLDEYYAACEEEQPWKVAL
jgi:hypothetical protein